MVYGRVGEAKSYSRKKQTNRNEDIIYNLVAGMQYEINVISKYGNITSADSKILLETILPPPSKIMVKGETRSSVSVTWQPSAIWVEAYLVEFEDQNGNISNKEVENSRTVASFKNLQQAALYQIRLWIRNSKIDFSDFFLCFQGTNILRTKYSRLSI